MSCGPSMLMRFSCGFAENLGEVKCGQGDRSCRKQLRFHYRILGKSKFLDYPVSCINGRFLIYDSKVPKRRKQHFTMIINPFFMKWLATTRTYGLFLKTEGKLSRPSMHSSGARHVHRSLSANPGNLEIFPRQSKKGMIVKRKFSWDQLKNMSKA